MGLGKTNRCTVCSHAEIDAINEEIGQGLSTRAIGVAYGLHHNAVWRHTKNCLLNADDGQGLGIISMRDVFNIPLQMRERGELIKSLLDRALSPLMQAEVKGAKLSAIDATQMGFIIRLLRLQQIDEQTILRITGVLKDGEGATGKGELVVSQQYALVHDALMERIQEISMGEGVAAAEARLALADTILPMDQVPRPASTNPFTYTDLGAIDADG